MEPWDQRVVLLIAYFLASIYGNGNIRKPPTITKHPSANVIYRGDTAVTLECEAEGIPAVSYEWKKNGFEVNQNLHNVHIGAYGTLTIEPDEAKDEGVYQCFVRNQYGTAVSSTAHIQRAMLDSTSGAAYLRVTVQEGMPFHIQASPRKSFPKPTYGWEVSSDTLDRYPTPLRSSRRIQIAENGDLHFAYALPEDELEGRIYKCTTYNPHLDLKVGGSFTQLTVTRNLTGFGPFQPTLEFSSDAQTVAIIGGSVTLKCFFSGYPDPTISWSGPRNNLPIGRYTLKYFDTEFTFSNVTASDEGNYICTASNTQGRDTHTLQLRVEALPRFLTVKDGPHDVNVTDGESFTFNCNADAKPEATVAWFQNGQPLDSNNLPVRFVFCSDLKSLTIRNVCRDCVDRDSKTDLMVIQCNASNVHGYAFAQGYLNVLQSAVLSSEISALHATIPVANETEAATVSPVRTPSGSMIQDFWVWIVIGLVLLILIFSACTVIILCRHKDRNKGEINKVQNEEGLLPEPIEPGYATIDDDCMKPARIEQPCLLLGRVSKSTQHEVGLHSRSDMHPAVEGFASLGIAAAKNPIHRTARNESTVMEKRRQELKKISAVNESSGETAEYVALTEKKPANSAVYTTLEQEKEEESPAGYFAFKSPERIKRIKSWFL